MHVAIALRAILNESPDMRLVGEARKGNEVLDLIKKSRPQVLFLDIVIEPDFDVFAVVRTIKEKFPEVKVCLLSAYLEPSYVRELLKAGVHGYILKDDDYVSNLESIIRDLIDGQIYLSQEAHEALALATRQSGEEGILSDREREILRFVGRGLPNPQIAQTLHLSPGTVRNHLSAVYRKLGVNNRREAVVAAKEQGLL